MIGKTIGYVRVSTFKQNHGRQLENFELDKIFTDKCSGKDTKRPTLVERFCRICKASSALIDKSKILDVMHPLKF
jgi:DNA invertase Pin-like site-specific DNA recombinase